MYHILVEHNVQNKIKQINCTQCTKIEIKNNLWNAYISDLFILYVLILGI